MNCEQVRNQLLEGDADLWEEELHIASPFHQHISGCAECRALLETLSKEVSAVSLAYVEIRPRLNSGSAADAVLAQENAAQAGSASGHRARWSLLVGLTSAAAAASIFAFAGRKAELPPSSETPAPMTVAVPGNQSAIVFETKDPNITVVWLISGDNYP